MNLPGLPVHALHPEFLPAGIQQQHLLLDLKLFFRWQISLGHQLVSSLQNIAHTALMCSQFHHKTLKMVQADTSLWGPIRVYDLVDSQNYHFWNSAVEWAGTTKCTRMADLFLSLTKDFLYATKILDPVKQRKKDDHLNERYVWEKTNFKQTHQEYETETYLWPREHKTTSEMYCSKAIRTLWVNNIYLLCIQNTSSFASWL